MKKLDNRQIEILKILSDAEDYLPVHIIAEKLGISTKTAYRDIEKIIDNVEDIKLLKKQGKGIKIKFLNYHKLNCLIEIKKRNRKKQY